MKNYKTIIMIAMLVVGASLFNACTNSSKKKNSPDSESTSKSLSSQKEDRKEEESIDGVYTGSQNISGLELVAKLTISGKRWSATSQFGYDSPEFQNGIVDGKDLYDDSGSIKIGYVSGSSASIDGYPSMRK